MATETPTKPPADEHPHAEPIVRDKLYIGGQWVEPDGKGTIEVLDAATEELIGSVPEGSATDAERAADAARAAFEGWSKTPAAERAQLCAAVAQALGERAEEL